MGHYIVNIIFDTFQAALFITAMFYLGVSVFSLFPFKYKKPEDEYKKFIVIIPAHNEESVIESVILSLKQQNYPKELVKVFVMADFCTDFTEKKAYECGASVLLRKTDERTKGAALYDAFRQILDLNLDFDSVVIVDADNIVDVDFLSEINFMMQQGHSVVQGYVDSLNPNESWVAYAYSMWYWITNRITQTGFSRLSLNCKINGTGFAVAKNVLGSILMKSNSLAEDTEYTVRLELESCRIAFAPKAVVYDKKPESFSVSIRQRKRWAKGNIDVLRKYFLKLIKNKRISDLLSLISDFMIPICWIFFLIVDFTVVSDLTGIIRNNMFLLWSNTINLFLLNVYVFGMLLSVCCGLLIDKKLNTKFMLNIFGFIIYILSWIPITISGLFSFNDRSWYHTGHKKNR